MNGYVFGWLIMAVTALILEMGHPGLFLCLSFCFGGLAAAIAGMLEFSVVVQSIIFLTSTAVSFALLHKLSKKVTQHTPATNVYALQGKRGTVKTTIAKHAIGTVQIGGDIWSAKAVHEDEIISGTRVEIIRVEGVHVIVCPIEN